MPSAGAFSPSRICRNFSLATPFPLGPESDPRTGGGAALVSIAVLFINMMPLDLRNFCGLLTLSGRFYRYFRGIIHSVNNRSRPIRDTGHSASHGAADQGRTARRLRQTMTLCRAQICARLATDLLLNALGQPRFSWGSTSLIDAGQTRQSYVEALRAADNHDFTPLMNLIRS